MVDGCSESTWWTGSSNVAEWTYSSRLHRDEKSSWRLAGAASDTSFLTCAVYEMRRIWKRHHCSKASIRRLEMDVVTSNIRLAVDKLTATLHFQVILACDEFPTWWVHSKLYIPIHAGVSESIKVQGGFCIFLLCIVLDIISSLWVRLTASLVSRCVAWRFGLYLVLTKVLTYCLRLFVHFFMHSYIPVTWNMSRLPYTSYVCNLAGFCHVLQNELRAGFVMSICNVWNATNTEPK